MLQAVTLAFVCLVTYTLPAIVHGGDRAVGQLLLKGTLRDPWLWFTHEFNRRYTAHAGSHCLRGSSSTSLDTCDPLLHLVSVGTAGRRYGTCP